MSVVEALALGIVQGLTEFLPISSSAHLRVVPALLGWKDPGVAYSAVIQLGSVLAVLSYFWKDLIGILFGSFKAVSTRQWTNGDLRLLAAICVGTVPICVFGLLLKSLLEQPHGPFRSLTLIGVASIVMGFLLLLAERAGKRTRCLDDITPKEGFIVGLGQTLALIPGCSRSGSTLTFALFLDLKRDEAARFSFLLGIPAIALSGLLELADLYRQGIGSAGVTDLTVGLFSSAVVSYLAIAWLIKYLSNHSTSIFVVYRLVFGATIVVMSWQSWIR